MNIQVAKSEIFRALDRQFGHSETDGIYLPNRLWGDLSVREKRWLVAEILNWRGDTNGQRISLLVQSGNPNYSDFVLVDDLPSNVGI